MILLEIIAALFLLTAFIGTVYFTLERLGKIPFIRKWVTGK